MASQAPVKLAAPDPAEIRRDYCELSCPCGSSEEYTGCCGPIISGDKSAVTAEALMRARYSAYVKVDVDFLLNSLHPDGSGGVDRESTKSWAENADWQGLEVLSTQAGGEKDETGEVEFVAKFGMQGEPQRHHEKAAFKRHEGKWLYLDGAELRPPPVVGPKVKLGRNDSCVCGSDRKFKKCCRAVFDAGAASPEALVRARFTAPLVGESRFLTASLHPEASHASGSASAEPPRALEMGVSTRSGDEAQVDATVFAEAGAAGNSQKHLVKQVNNHWLFVSCS